MTLNITTTRPLDNPNNVGVAELAQWNINNIARAQPADEVLRMEWPFEIDHGNQMNFLDWKKGRIMFIDGSSITFKEVK